MFSLQLRPYSVNCCGSEDRNENAQNKFLWGRVGMEVYFWFLNTNGRHVGILLPVLIFTFASPSACHSASVYQISSESDHPRRSYNVMFIFQDGSRQSYWISQGNCRPPTRCKWGSDLGRQISTRSDLGDIAIFMLWGFGLKLPTWFCICRACAEARVNLLSGFKTLLHCELTTHFDL